MNNTTSLAVNENIITHSLNNLELSRQKLEQRIINEFGSFCEFVINHKLGNYTFDFYFSDFKLALQIDAYSYAYSNIFNVEKLKFFTIPHQQIRVLKISDYQILVDSDEIIRFLRTILEPKLQCNAQRKRA